MFISFNVRDKSFDFLYGDSWDVFGSLDGLLEAAFDIIVVLFISLY